MSKVCLKLKLVLDTLKSSLQNTRYQRAFPLNFDGKSAYHTMYVWVMTAGVSSAAIPQLQHVNCVEMISFYKFTEQCLGPPDYVLCDHHSETRWTVLDV